MLRFLPIVFAFSLQFSVIVFGQELVDLPEAPRSYYQRRTLNESFEGLNAWNSIDRGGSISVLDWNQLPAGEDSTGDNQLFLTRGNESSSPVAPPTRAIQMRGASSLWQYASVNGKSKYQVIACNGRKRLIPGASGPTGWAGYGVTYYDANWNTIGFFEVPISEDKKPASLGAQPQSQSALGVQIPAGAQHSILWVSNDGTNTETYASELILLNMFVGKPLIRTLPSGALEYEQNPNEDTLIVNQELVQTAFYDYDFEDTELLNPFRGVVLDRELFWEKSGTSDFGVFITGLGECAYWQQVSLSAGKKYQLKMAYSLAGDPPAATGVDFFDSNWNKISTVSTGLDGIVSVRLPITQGQASLVELNFQVPPNAAYSYVWNWRSAGEGVFSRDQLTLRPSP